MCKCSECPSLLVYDALITWSGSLRAPIGDTKAPASRGNGNRRRIQQAQPFANNCTTLPMHFCAIAIRALPCARRRFSELVRISTLHSMRIGEFRSYFRHAESETFQKDFILLLRVELARFLTRKAVRLDCMWLGAPSSPHCILFLGKMHQRLVLYIESCVGCVRKEIWGRTKDVSGIKMSLIVWMRFERARERSECRSLVWLGILLYMVNNIIWWIIYGGCGLFSRLQTKCDDETAPRLAESRGLLLLVCAANSVDSAAFYRLLICNR